MTMRGSIKYEISKAIDDLKPRISDSECRLRHLILERLPYVFLDAAKPLLIDPDFRHVSTIFMLVVSLADSDIEHTAQHLNKESVSRVAKMDYALIGAASEDPLFACEDNNDYNKATSELRRVAFMSTDEQLDTALNNLPAVISFMLERDANYQLILDMLPELVCAPALVEGVL